MKAVWSRGLDIADDDWRDLAERALEPNVFHAPDFLRPAARGIGPPPDHVAVRSDDGRLHGFLPLTSGRGRLTVWTSPYAPDGTFLIGREDPDAAIAAALDLLASTPGLPSLLALPYFPRRGALADALDRSLSRLGLRSGETGVHARAVLAKGDGDALRGKRRKELGRQRRRLSDLGEVAVSTHEGADVASALDLFLALEAAGWKGRRGSAMLQRADARRFVREAIPSLAAIGAARIVRLTCGGETAAAAIVLRDGVRAWLWKIAYDERLAKRSPGVLLTLELTRLLDGEDGPQCTDSCAVAGHPMIDRLWRGRRELSNRLIAVRPGHALRLRAGLAGDAALDRLRAAVRRLAQVLPGHG